MTSGKLNTFIWLHEQQAAALRQIARDNALAESAWVDAERERLGVAPDEPTPEHIRVQALALRPGTWPGVSHLVEAAMRVRLTAPDLAGPWAPFTPSEREAQRLAGRRSGTPNQHFTDKIVVDLDPALVSSAQLAAYRISEPVVALLRAENLMGPGASRSRSARARKAELQAQIYTVGRIAREAIDRMVTG